MKVTDFVFKDNRTRFSHFRNGVLFYTVTSKAGETRMFPVPVDDLAGATIRCEEKSMLLMRYIRLAIKDKTLVLYAD